MFAIEVGQELRDSLARAGIPALFSNFVLLPLSQPGKILSDSPSLGWAQLIRASCLSVHGSLATAVKIAAAMEALAAGLDILDEIEDSDHSPFVLSAGLPQALNASTALIFLSQRIVSELREIGVDPTLVVDCFFTLARLGLNATHGQHKDLSTDARSGISLDAALQITSEKSGSLAACACRLGARLGTAEPEILQLYEQFGQHYGTMVQLSNDLHDAQNDVQKTDLARAKPTLPVLFYVRQLGSGTMQELTTKDVINSGALHFAWTIFEMQRKRCLSILDELDERDQMTAHIRSIIGQSRNQEHTVDE
ncbi:MAG TPA: polyprenyl synthetase family protein [Nitrolancea sp.]